MEHSDINRETLVLPKIGSYWYGRALGRLERACLRSMIERGHDVTLFCHDYVDGVPEEVEVLDAREITGDRSVVMFDSLQSPALFSDQFRYHMIALLGWLWLDLDTFALKPVLPNDGYLFGYDPATRRRYINGGVLGLPKSSQTLRDLVLFCEEYYPIPPFETRRKKAELYIKKCLGSPVHVSSQRWGTWGPRALTYFLRRNGEEHYALERELYPIDWNSLDVFLLPHEHVNETYLQDAIAVHLYGSLIRRKIEQIGPDQIPNGSFLANVLKYGD